MGIESENGNKGETHTERYQWDKHWHIRKSNGKHTIQYGNKKKHHNWVLGDIGCISHPLTLGSFLALPYKNCLPGKMPYSTLYFVMALQLLDHVLRELFQRTLQKCSKESRQTLQF